MSLLEESKSFQDRDGLSTKMEDTNLKVSKPRSIWFHLKTLYLFTCGDFKTAMAPQATFAISLVCSGAKLTIAEIDQPTISHIATRLPFMAAWLWLLLLVADIANQRLPNSIIEDSINKPWRPLPSGRLSVDEAQLALRVVVPVAVVAGLLLENFMPSAIILVLAWLYNDLDGANAGPLQRNAINAVALSCFGWGAVETLLGHEGHVSVLVRNWVVLTSVVTLTTVHVYDFPDIDGDRARGRRTIPLVYRESWARASLAVLVLLWSAVCPFFWNVRSPAVWVAILAIGSTMAATTTLRRGQSYDDLVGKLWCLWMCLLYILPLFGTRG